LFFISALIVILATLFDATASGASMHAQLVTPVKNISLTDTISLAGKIEPETFEEIKSKWGAILTKIYVRVGQFVKKSTLVAESDQKFSSSFARLLKQNILVMLGTLKLKKRAFKQSNEKRRRIERLVKKGIESRNKLDELETEYINHQIGLLGAQTALDRSRESLNEAKARVRAGNFYSSIDGVVSAVIISPDQFSGSFYAGGRSVIARIDKPNKYIIKAKAIDRQINQINVGDSINISSPSLKGMIKGKVSKVAIDDEAQKTGKNLFDVTVRFSYKKGYLPRGTLAEITKTIKYRKTATVSWNAVEWKDGHAVIRSSSAKGVISHKVKLGHRNDLRVSISGLKKIPKSVISRGW
jgi:multidrug efflux pump subunit AcrA (membrane-fusion protein)